MIKSIFYGKMVNGKFEPDSPDQFRITREKLEGQIVQITLSKKRTPRSVEENRYYWGVVVKIISEEVGLNQDDTHEMLKWKFLKIGRIKKINGELHWQIEFPRSTTTLSTVEFEDFMSKVRMWSQEELNTTIPLPNEVEL